MMRLEDQETYLYAPYSGAGEIAWEVGAVVEYLQHRPDEQLASEATEYLGSRWKSDK